LVPKRRCSDKDGELQKGSSTIYMYEENIQCILFVLAP
jgi:hypothetical protein